MRPEEIIEKYKKSGLGIPFPLPYRKKSPPPAGVTGYNAKTPTEEQISRWIEEGRYANYGFKVPEGIMGIDYDERKGGDVYDWLKPYMDLAPRSTSRGFTNPSGIYLIRVPNHLLGELRDRHLAEFGTEAIRPGHRYFCCWPSLHKDSGDMYQWYLPGQEIPIEGPPNIDLIPEIPEDVFLEGMRSAPRTTNSYRAGVSQGAPKRAIEPKDLGSIKALLAGYHTYEINPDEEMIHTRKTYEEKRIRAITDDLESLISSSDPWEPTVGSLALTLFSIALAPWTELTPEQALLLIVEHGPTCDKAEELGVHDHAGHCWSKINLEARAERSLGQHDGAWTQLPTELRAAHSATIAVSDDDDWETSIAVGSGSSDGEDDDFFFEEDPDDDLSLVWLTDEVPIDDPPDPISGGIAYSGVLNIISAAGGVGKSTVISKVCSENPKTLWLSNEEAQSSIHQRAAILGSQDFAVFNRVVTVNDIHHIIKALKSNPEIKNIVLDNLQAFFALGEGSNLNNVVREKLNLLYRYTLGAKITIIGITHPPKSAASAINGSSAWGEVSRHVISAHSMFHDNKRYLSERVGPKDHHYVLLRVAKSNYHRGSRNYWLVKTHQEDVPRLTISGRQTQDWAAEFMPDEESDKAYSVWLEANTGEADSSKPKRKGPKNDELPEMEDPEVLITGYWEEADGLAKAIGIPLAKLHIFLAKYDLMAARGGENRLIYTYRMGEVPPIEPFSAGEFPLDELMATARVSQKSHLMWLVSEAGFDLTLNENIATMSLPSQDETEAALDEAGLGDLT